MYQHQCVCVCVESKYNKIKKKYQATHNNKIKLKLYTLYVLFDAKMFTATRLRVTRRLAIHIRIL